MYALEQRRLEQIAREEKSDRELKESRQEHARLLRLYRVDPELRRVADKVHESRLMSGRACAQCISIALHKLGRGSEANAETAKVDEA